MSSSTRIAASVLMLSALAGLGAAAHAAAPVTLGAAGSYAVLGLENGTVSINSSTSIIGSVGYCGSVTSATNQKVETFIGAADVHSTATFTYTPATFAPSLGIHIGTMDATLNQAHDDAVAASAAIAAMPPTHVLGALGDNDNVVINSVGPVNVISLTSLNYNSDHLDLVSRPGQHDLFLFNVSGSFDFSNSAIYLTGIGAGQVLFNFPNASAITLNKAGNLFRGTILAPLGSVEYHNPAVFEGAIIARTITLHSDFNMTFVPFDSGTTPIEPATWGGIKALYR